MKKILVSSTIILLVSSFHVIIGQAIWTQKASLPSTPRWGAIGFSIGSKGYVGTGYDGSTNYGDFWEYDPITNSWSQKASLSPRRAASAFVIGTKGYVCMGANSGSPTLVDTWEYDPSNNTWTQKANLPSNPRYGCAGFAIGTKGYIGCGNEGSSSGPYTNEFWEFDPSANTWMQKASLPGAPRYGITHMGWALAGKGYIAMGLSSTGWLNDLYAYDPATDSWTQKANFPGTGRSYAVAFSSCNSYYAGTGQNNGSAMNDIWKYNPSNDSWTQTTNFGGGNRWIMTSCVINSIAYVGTGYDFTNYYNDWWEYRCGDEGGVFEQPNAINYTSIYPNVFSSYATLEINKDVFHKSAMRIFDMTGRLVKQEEIVAKKSTIQKNNLPKGMYLFEVICEGAKIGWGKFIIE